MSLHRIIINKFVKEGCISWARDTKSASQLIKKFPKPDFWDWVEPYPLVDMLPYLLTAKNIKLISEKYIVFLQQKDLKLSKQNLKESLDSERGKTYNLSSEKVGEDISLISKPKTLKEFLNYGKST